LSQALSQSGEPRPRRAARRPLLLPALGTAAALALAGAAFAQGAAAPPGFTAAQAERGAALYSANCALCHGDNLDDGQFAPPLKGSIHADYWKGRTASDLLTYMATAMPPTQPGGLGVQAYADIMAYLLQNEGVAPGDKEIPPDPGALTSAAPTL